MAEFAQSREDNDLFADEFEPVVAAAAEIIEPKAEPASVPAESRPSASERSQQRNGRAPGGRGGQDRRGRGGGRGAANGLSQSRYAPQAQAPAGTLSPSHVTPPTTSSPPPADTPSAPEPPPAATPSAPAPEAPRTYAVRGDRSATGGKAHKKLTEAELAEKMAKMAVLDKQRAEKHRLTEADQAAFQRREKELAKERREKALAEKKNARVMEMERAKNRQRKMKAQGGREWDSEKLGSDLGDRSRGRTSEYVRGGHGGVRRGGLAGSMYSIEQGRAQVPGSRGRGGFEIRGRGKTGRVGKQNNTVPSAEDFPSLPTVTKPEAGEPANRPAPGPAKATSIPSADVPIRAAPADENEKPAGDWAEEMAIQAEEKKM
ncbi:hypothetical protein QTJ16_003037 [Diplocarpon rosae]|uniref:Uncharacterized protein n=1 Tax=Diplocarpon rosae TaxID=946125 RepID=A0AAD9T0M8_9HELO|nr:hypothetical protein QTJ16_003037 [Diplocarpon rosae]